MSNYAITPELVRMQWNVRPQVLTAIRLGIERGMRLFYNDLNGDYLELVLEHDAAPTGDVQVVLTLAGFRDDECGSWTCGEELW